VEDTLVPVIIHVLGHVMEDLIAAFALRHVR